MRKFGELLMSSNTGLPSKAERPSSFNLGKVPVRFDGQQGQKSSADGKNHKRSKAARLDLLQVLHIHIRYAFWDGY